MSRTTGDVFSKAKRSAVMRGVRRSGTAAELRLRTIVRECDAHYRLNNRALPGSPDLSNVTGGWAIFVHGCFWHGHPYCQRTKGDHRGRIPTTNADWWERKLASNRERDSRKSRALRGMGLNVLTVWECELKHAERLRRRVRRFLDRADARRQR